jgi:hypothetical protein
MVQGGFIQLVAAKTTWTASVVETIEEYTVASTHSK